MKKILLICLITLIVGCEKKTENVDDKSAAIQFEKSDQKISEFLDILDNPNAIKDQHMKILCKDYPIVYEQEYLPALLKLSNDLSKDKLMNDLKISTDYYSEKLGISCD